MKIRNLLGLLALSGVSATSVPRKWVKPVIKATELPAHAKCSPCDSDIRLKTNVEKLECSEIEFQLYRFEYLDDVAGKTYVGVMAQDLKESHPEALDKRSDGFYRVRYQSLGLKMTTLEEWNKKGIEAVKIH